MAGQKRFFVATVAGNVAGSTFDIAFVQDSTWDLRNVIRFAVTFDVACACVREDLQKDVRTRLSRTVQPLREVLRWRPSSWLAGLTFDDMSVHAFICVCRTSGNLEKISYSMQAMWPYIRPYLTPTWVPTQTHDLAIVGMSSTHLTAEAQVREAAKHCLAHA